MTKYDTVFNGAQLLKFDILGRYGIKHAFSTRVGGVSSEPFSSLNIGASCGDSSACVERNRRVLCAAIGSDYSKMTVCNQVHGAKVHVVYSGNCGNVADSSVEVCAADAMITNTAGVVLQCAFADCVPILMYEPNVRAIAVAHAGWRGTVAGVATAAAKAMCEQYAANMRNILVAIGPAIGSCCFEVDAPVAQHFYDGYGVDSRVIVNKGNGKYNIDLERANKLLVLQSGINSINIACAHVCTSCNTDKFYSYRKECGKTGRHAAIIAL